MRFQFPHFLSAILAVFFLAQSAWAAQPPEQLVAEGVAKVLPGYQFNKRLAGPTQEDHILLFNKGAECAVVTWTTGASKSISIPANPTTFNVFNTAGSLVGNLSNQTYAAELFCGDIPAIFVPVGENSLLLMAALAEQVPPKKTVRGPQIVYLESEFVNPTDKPLVLSMPGKKSVALKPGEHHLVTSEVEVGRSFEPLRALVGASGVYQQVMITSENPLMIDVRADLPGKLTVDILNPTADPFSGRMAMRLVGSNKAPFEFPVDMGPRETIKTLEVPLGIQLPLPSPVQLVLSQYVGDPRREIVLTQTGAMQFVGVRGLAPDSQKMPQGWKLAESGELFVQLRAGQPPQGAPWGDDTVMAAYRFEEPGATFSLKPINAGSVPIVERPTSVGMWINGDGSGNLLSVRWRDAQGKLYQPKARKIDWKGWNYITFATDAAMEPPLQWDSLVYVEAASASSGALMVSGPVFSYQSSAPSAQAKEEDSQVEIKDNVSFGDPVKLNPESLQPMSIPSSQ
ncbi:hypothetical protein [Cerasicoccus frondis]|uniref:hypothetical protein n=1 Tax=Cerasicoccus frondis TaxID=490090 RepID=UPI0028528634|nr:hypothetical protein [Cerasicoccus frondis]